MVSLIERRGAIRGLPGPRALNPEPLRLDQVTPNWAHCTISVKNNERIKMLLCIYNLD